VRCLQRIKRREFSRVKIRFGQRTLQNQALTHAIDKRGAK
jgi:hypothetical protein